MPKSRAVSGLTGMPRGVSSITNGDVAYPRTEEDDQRVILLFAVNLLKSKLLAYEEHIPGPPANLSPVGVFYLRTIPELISIFVGSL
jgi:hypothetical protein